MPIENDAMRDIESSRSIWLDRLAAGDLDGYLDVMAADIVWLPPRGQPLVGVSALRTWLAAFLAQYSYVFTLSGVQIRVAGDRAFERGAYRSLVTPVTGGEPAAHDGLYALLWRRDSDGRWRIERYADATDLMPLSHNSGTDLGVAE